MERRVLEWVFAPGAGGVTVTLFLFSSLLVCFFPMTDDEKFRAVLGTATVLAVLHYFVARCESLMRFFDKLLSVLSSITLYVLTICIFAVACHALTGVAIDSAWLRIAAQIASASYVWAGLRLVRIYGGADTSVLKIVWLSWLMTPLLTERLLIRCVRRQVEALMAKWEKG